MPAGARRRSRLPGHELAADHRPAPRPSPRCLHPPSRRGLSDCGRGHRAGRDAAASAAGHRRRHPWGNRHPPEGRRRRRLEAILLEGRHGHGRRHGLPDAPPGSRARRDPRGFPRGRPRTPVVWLRHRHGPRHHGRRGHRGHASGRGRHGGRDVSGGARPPRRQSTRGVVRRLDAHHGPRLLRVRRAALRAARPAGEPARDPRRDPGAGPDRGPASGDGPGQVHGRNQRDRPHRGQHHHG